MPTAPSIDILTSPTLKHLRERWWNDEFTEFLRETLRPRAGNRILDVGCGEGYVEVAIGRLRSSQIAQVGVDLVHAKVVDAKREAAAHNQRASFVAGDAVALPFLDGAFDSTYCVAVLQHLSDVEAAVSELARVTRGGGRVLAVEPDNSARYSYSSVPSGAPVFEAARELFAAISEERGQTSVGPHVPELFARHRIEPVAVRVFPVSLTFLRPPSAAVWAERRQAVARMLVDVSDSTRELAASYGELLQQYEREAQAAGSAFVEIQNTMLFATLGERG
jgi:ubiquinone/menaquinone biosynthesis C-methylase UbiE